MAIALACPGCAQSVPVNGDMAGRRARCPHCRLDLTLPSSLVELPDHNRDSDTAPQPSPREPRTVLPWLLIGGAVLAVLALLCGAPVALVTYLLREEREASELAQRARVSPPGAELPKGAPPRAMRVAGFEGIFRTTNQLAPGDVVFTPNNGGGKNNARVCKEYVIDLEAGKTYIINLDGDTRQFDPYLRLAEISGQVLAEDDDGGGNLNSQIQFVAPVTKSYLVVATSLAGGFGPFTLTVREARFSRPR